MLRGATRSVLVARILQLVRGVLTIRQVLEPELDLRDFNLPQLGSFGR